MCVCVGVPLTRAAVCATLAACAACVQGDLDEFELGAKGGGTFTEILQSLKNDQKTKKKRKKDSSSDDPEVVCMRQRERARARESERERERERALCVYTPLRSNPQSLNPNPQSRTRRRSPFQSGAGCSRSLRIEQRTPRNKEDKELVQD